MRTLFTTSSARAADSLTSWSYLSTSVPGVGTR